MQKGSKIYIRLGKVQEICDYYEDKEDEASYGFIQICSIDMTYIEFSVNLVYEDNSCTSDVYKLKLGESIDINNDLIPDLHYEIPSENRKGYENLRYLTFMSSMELKNTTMFCVIPEQYKNQEYPNGIMGVNPDGNYIVTKYHLSDSSRCITSGLQYGDYVFDRISGKYQKIVSSSIIYGRAIQENELEDVQSDTLLFEQSDFHSVSQMNDFYSHLIEFGLIDDDGGNVITRLNDILQDRHLIERAYNLTLIEDITELNKEDVFSNVNNMDLDLIIYLNRSFLSYLFPEYCSKKEKYELAEIFPLLFCNIGGNDDYKEVNSDISRSILTSNFEDYAKQRNEIYKEYKKYFNLPFGLKKYTVITKSKNDNQSKLLDWDFKIGIQGKIENIWGSKIEMDIAFVIFANIETELDLSKQFYEKSLIGGQKELANIKIPVNLGVINLSVNFPLSFDLLFSINGNGSFPSPIYGGFTGLYGVEAGCGIDYSVSWKKILFVSYPSLSKSDFYVKKDAVCKTAAQISALDCISVEAKGTIGVDSRFQISSLNEPVKLAMNNKLPITSNVGFYIVPTVVSGAGEVHLPGVFYSLFHKKWRNEFTISEFGTEIKLWNKVLF